jgi:hypothetical protein
VPHWLSRPEGLSSRHLSNSLVIYGSLWESWQSPIGSIPHSLQAGPLLPSPPRTGYRWRGQTLETQQSSGPCSGPS